MDSILIGIPVQALKFENVQILLSTSRYVVRINDYPILFKSIDGVGFDLGDYVKVYGRFDEILDVETLIGLDMKDAT